MKYVSSWELFNVNQHPVLVTVHFSYIRSNKGVKHLYWNIFLLKPRFRYLIPLVSFTPNRSFGSDYKRGTSSRVSVREQENDRTLDLSFRGLREVSHYICRSSEEPFGKFRPFQWPKFSVHFTYYILIVSFPRLRTPAYLVVKLRSDGEFSRYKNILN